MNKKVVQCFSLYESIYLAVSVFLPSPSAVTNNSKNETVKTRLN